MVEVQLVVLYQPDEVLKSRVPAEQRHWRSTFKPWSRLWSGITVLHRSLLRDARWSLP